MKLTLPATDIGARAIKVDGQVVGAVLADFHWNWTAYLWTNLDGPTAGRTSECYRRHRLDDIRTEGGWP